MRPHLQEILDECIEAGELKRGLDPWSVYNVIWTSMQGVASQYVCDRLPPVNPDAYARVMADLVIAGLKAGTQRGSAVREGLHPAVDRPQKALTGPAVARLNSQDRWMRLLRVLYRVNVKSLNCVLPSGVL